MSLQAKPFAKRSHKKSRAGCKSCKIRKVKCDEKRPLCGNCVRHYSNILECEWDTASSSTVGNLPGVRRHQSGDQSASSRAHAEEYDENRLRRLAGRKLSLPASVGAGLLDPFEAYPQSSVPNEDVDLLMNHYLSTVIFRSFPIFATSLMVEVWWPFVRTDDVLFHVTLLLSGMSLEKLKSEPSGRHSKTLLAECISLLSKRVQNPISGVSDQTIVAVANLATIEHEKGNMRALQMHMDGLKKMVSSRGGLNTIRSTNPLAASVIFWLSMVVINESQNLRLNFGDIEEAPRWLYATSSPTPNMSDLEFEQMGVDTPTAMMMYEVKYLSGRFSAKVDYDSANHAVCVLTRLCSILQILLRQDPPPGDTGSLADISESCRYAAALHIFNPLSGYYPDPTLTVHTLVTKLKASMQSVISFGWRGTRLLLWLLSVGGVSALRMPLERAWFVGYLVVVVTDLDMESWHEMKAVLVEVAWHDAYCEGSFGNLWDEIMAKKETLKKDEVGT